MAIEFDSDNALIGLPGVPVVGEPFGVVRDWVGHLGESYSINVPQDFTWSGSSHTATASLPGPYGDVDNQIYYESGPDSLIANISIEADNSEPIVEIAAWVRFDDVPTPISVDYEFVFAIIRDAGTDVTLEVSFLFKTDNTVTLTGRFSNDGIVFHSFTHPDDMARTGWLFFAAQFDHGNGPVDTIVLDPGNNNLQSADPGPNIDDATYDTVELIPGTGQSPGNAKGIRFANLFILRDPPAGVVDEDAVFTTPGADTFLVPGGTTSVVATMWSGGGGGGGGVQGAGNPSLGGAGGGSGFTKATHTVTPAETLDLFVGGGGGGGATDTFSCEGGGGGGRSYLRRGATNLQITGTGGGGGGGDNSSTTPGGVGGDGGGSVGGDGGASSSALPGEGGTQVAGGAGGVGGNTGDAGSLDLGGDGANGGGGTGGAVNGGTGLGGDGGLQSVGLAGGGGGGNGYYGGGGGGSSVSADAGGGGGGGGSSFFDAGATSITDTQSSGQTPGGTGDPLYLAPAGEGGDGGPVDTAGDAGSDGRVVLSYTPGTPTWRAIVRAFTTQEELDEYQLETAKAVRYFRTSEWDLGGGFGDRYVHDISGFLNGAAAPTGTLVRNVGQGPIDVNNSYEYQGGCSASTEISTKSLFYDPPSTWDLSWFCFFREPASVTNDDSWFVRFENDAGEFVQLERISGAPTILRRRVQFSSGPPIVDDSTSTPLFDGSWHRLVMTADETTAGNWDVAIDGTRYFPDVTPVALSTPITRVRWGNIDVNLALNGWANYYDGDLYTTFTSQVSEFAIRGYIEAHTDAVPAGTDYYLGYYPQQDSNIGSA